MQLTVDIECYSNYFLAVFTNSNGKSKSFEIFNDDYSKFPSEEIFSVLIHPDVELISFNGACYDLPLLTLAVSGFNTNQLKAVSDEIIDKNLKPWHIYKQFDIEEPPYNHIDLIEVSIGIVSLKIYGGRLGSKKMQDLPLKPDTVIREDQLPEMRKYCRNDTLVTWDLFNTLRGQIDLRREMSKTYGIDLRSKSDAQIAEAVLKSEYQRIAGSPPEKVILDYNEFYYEPPSYIKFLTAHLQDKFKTICESKMVIKDTGHVAMPKAIEKMKIKIGQSTYKIGIGGLHSQESEVAHHATDEEVLIDRDVTSYYPNLMLNMGMSPGGFGEHFQTIYRKILEDRIKAKRENNNVVSDSLKIVLNGTFGKTSNRYSTLYSPKMMVRTTLTGQLSLLMLIEALEMTGFSVVSANTDGIVIKCPVVKRDAMNRLIEAWEKRTNLNTEETEYKALYSRDVNSYIAVKPDGSAKTKGVYGMAGISKNPHNEICSIAAIEYVSKGTPIEETIRQCRSIQKFITVRTVSGGAIKDDTLLGKAIRWYYSTSTKSAIHYVKNGNTVPRSEGAMPVMDLPEDLPTDIDYQWYIDEAKDILMAVGAIPRPVLEKVPRKNSKAWKDLVASGEIKEDRKGKWQWTNPEQHLGASAA